MFEKEIEEIKNKYENSLEITKKLTELYKNYEYNGSKRKNIFYLDIRISETPETVKKHALRNLDNLIQCNRLESVVKRFNSRNNETSLEEAYKIIENINIDTFYNALTYYQPYIIRNGREAETIKTDNKKMFFQSHNNSEGDLLLTLNCIWLLNNNEVMTSETESKIIKLIRNNNNTFIFCGCKVTYFKNKKIQILFSDKELFNQFTNHIENGLKNAQNEYNKRNNGAA